LYFRNEGTNRDPRPVHKGFVQVNGRPLALPVKPVPKSPPGVYELEYYPVLEAVDGNGDGRTDPLAGGRLTGRWLSYVNVAGDGLLDLVVSASENIYLFFNVGTKPGPRFEVHIAPWPSSCGSRPLPTFGMQFIDWDGDGRQDILSGLTIYLNQGSGDYRPVG